MLGLNKCHLHHIDPQFHLSVIHTDQKHHNRNTSPTQPKPFYLPTTLSHQPSIFNPSLERPTGNTLVHTDLRDVIAPARRRKVIADHEPQAGRCDFALWSVLMQTTLSSGGQTTGLPQGKTGSQVGVVVWWVWVWIRV